jgi:hypothetical protein
MRSLLLLLTLLLAACGMDGTYYEKAPDSVRAALKSAKLPYHILGTQATGSRVDTPDDQTVVTAVLGPNNSEMVRFITTITADGTGSRVKTIIAPPTGPNAERAQAAMQQNGYATALLDKLATEHVAAAIEGRPFDMMFATDPMAKGMINADPQMKAHVDAANANAAAMSEMMHSDQFGDKSGLASDDFKFGDPVMPAAGSK